VLITVDRADDTALYEQLAAAVRRGLKDGELQDGERLPPARELAEQLDVNMHTVLKAYALLSDEGVLKVRRGRGAVVCSPDRALPAPVAQALDRLIAAADRHQVGRDQILNALKGSR
jgi:GntR family transcriptional regulator